MTGFVFLRARGHRLLLTAALLAVLLTTAVLATLAAFAGSVGDAGLRHALQTRNAAAASLVITSDNAEADRAEATRAAQHGARQTFDQLPVSLKEFDTSGPYALPRALQTAAARKGEPDLTKFAVADRSKVRLSAGEWPTSAPDGVLGVALPEAAAKALKLTPGPRVLRLTDRLHGPAVRIRVTGTYRPADRNDPYWQLDELGGRGVGKDSFTLYGPLLTDPAVLDSGRISHAGSAWLATADYGTLGAGRIDALRDTAKKGLKFLDAQPALKGSVSATTQLPAVLDQLERALLVSRATLLIVSLQLVLLAAYALLLVARLLSTERAGENEVLLARGASRGRIAGLAAVEALLLALPAAVCAPLLAGPLTRLLAGQGLLARIGLHLDTSLTAQVWLVGVLASLACALAVVGPALTAARSGHGRTRALPAPLRAGADVGLLVIAAVAYWQLDRRTLDSGALSGDREGELGIDPLLVVAPALALLAGTVLTLRLLPPAAKLAERHAVGGRGLTVSLAGWQFSRRPLRGAGTVLLLVLAVAMGMLALGQGASWDRSQDDQADFRAGAPVRVLGSSGAAFGQGGAYDELAGLRAAAPAARSEVGLSGGRRATLLALDTTTAGPHLRMRDDLAQGDQARLLAALRPEKAAPTGLLLPADTARLDLDITLRGPDEDPGVRAGNGLTVTAEDRYGVPYQLFADGLTPDGEPHTLTLDLDAAADAPVGKPAGPLTLTAIEFEEAGYPERVLPKRLTIGEIRAIGADGSAQKVSTPKDARWHGKATVSPEPNSLGGDEIAPKVTDVRATPGTPLDVKYHTGTGISDERWDAERTVTVRVAAARAEPVVPAALVTPRFLESSGAKTGSVVEVPLSGKPVKVKIAGVLQGVPTTGPGLGRPDPAGTKATTTDGGAMLLDLRAVNRVLSETRPDAVVTPTEWWLFTKPGKAAQVAAELRDRAEIDPGQIQVRDEIAEELHDDPLGAGPQTALLAVALVAAALAAVGFAVSTAGAVRERAAEFAVLRALGTPRRQLARLLAAEQSLLIGLALVIGVALGAVLTRAVVPLIVLTGQAAQPVPGVLVELPVGRVALLLAAVAAAPALIVAVLALRRGDPATALRVQGGER
ncbi:ABC transporter permease [Streptomyces sp. NBC_01304]|uniref:ABC transporter permease n=1 Tax=Streptomyces sp. NBC_01304 TaxID=2903818 RepID=UPI002E12C51A|nr:ABC transporter permease [Streptomyces sp. NBC_01304]